MDYSEGCGQCPNKHECAKQEVDAVAAVLRPAIEKETYGIITASKIAGSDPIALKRMITFALLQIACEYNAEATGPEVATRDMMLMQAFQAMVVLEKKKLTLEADGVNVFCTNAGKA